MEVALYLKEVIHCFTCLFCSRTWSIALHDGADHNLINKKLHCPWCGNSHVYVSDQDFK
jgi:transcription elongation factor Elf1